MKRTIKDRFLQDARDTYSELLDELVNGYGVRRPLARGILQTFYLLGELGERHDVRWSEIIRNVRART